MSYAAKTDVPAGRSLEEIDRTLRRYGATGFGYIRDDERGTVELAFRANGRHVRFSLPLPALDAFELTPTGRERSRASAVEAWEQACRARYRALLLTVKAKLESVASGIETFDEAFLPQLLLPSGRTVAQEVGPAVVDALDRGAPLSLPAALAGGVLALGDGGRRG